MVERESNGVGKKIIVGVCVMEKKVFSAPMGQILERLQAFGEFEIVYFGDKVILEEPIERPYLVNELEPQHLLHDRRKVYECLEMCGIPVPRYAFVNRDKPDQELDYFVEEEDFVEVRGQRFWKPFVEKPVHGDDHRIMIYYPSSAGGGMKELFRKVGNRSSEFHPDVRRVRREGSYIYEEFMPTGGTDVKTKLKSAVQLQDLLDATRILVPRIRPGRGSDSETEDIEHAEKLRQVKAVLEEGGHFSGIYRKVQLKPLKWVKVVIGDTEEERPIEALMVLKYGGVLTHAGRKQAEELGRYFRNNMYPGEGTGLLRLHSTYRHDLKIYSSDEGRVQMSAAAFAKGLLDLEGQLTPILVSLVSKDSSMLDGLENASIEMEEAKARLNDLITSGVRAVQANGSLKKPWMVDGAGLPPNTSELLPTLVKLTKKVTEQVRLLAKDEDEKLAETTSYDVIPPYDQARALGKTNIDVDRIAAGLPCGSEGFLLMYARWRKLERDLYNERKDRYDITQIPDVYDSCKYDLLHNAHLNIDGLDELFKVAQLLADGVIPNEYGINPKQKLKIGSKIARRLLGKILIDLRNTREEAINVAELKSQCQSSETTIKNVKEHTDHQPKSVIKNEESRRTSFTSDRSMDHDEDDDKEIKYRLDPKYANVKTPERHVRTRLYFTSESHIHSLMNVLRYCNLDESLQGEVGLICDNALERLLKTKELDYMSYIVLRMFENIEVNLEDPKRYRLEMTFSRGADLSPLEKTDIEAASLHQEHTLPIMGPERLQEAGEYLTLDKMEEMVRPFAMPAEDFPPPSTPQGFSGYFKSAGVLERLVNLWPFHKHANKQVD